WTLPRKCFSFSLFNHKESPVMKISKRLLLSSFGLAALCLPALSFAQVNTITVSNPSDSDPGSLRDAITSVAKDGDTVSIPSTISQITLTSGEILVLKSITIQGAGAGTTIIDGNANDRIFEIGNGSGNSVRITGVTIRNGATTSEGGGILVNNPSSL